MTTPEQRELMALVNEVYDLLAVIHENQQLALHQPLMLCGYDEFHDISMIVNFQYLPGRKTPHDLLEGHDYTALHLTEKPNLTLVPKDPK